MARSYAAKFIHFGLPKCGSTFLQSVWGEDAQYTAADLTQAANAARQFALKGQTSNLPRMDLGLVARPGSVMVASSEGFGWAFMGRPAEQPRIADLHRIAAQLTGQARIAPVALFMVRNPLDWIRSTHEQIIKRGDYDNGAQYLAKHRSLIERVLDLRHIREVFSAQFERVVFLSADEMRTDPDRFWSRYEAELDAPRPGPDVVAKVAQSDSYSNVSLKDRMIPLARMNRILSNISQAWTGLDSPPPHVAKEIEAFADRFNQARVWAARRVSEASSADALETMIGDAFSDMGDGFTDLPLDQALTAHLRTNFCDVLVGETSIPAALKAEYGAALEEAAS